MCEKGYFCFDVDKKKFTARAGETVFLSEGNNFSIGELSDDLRVSILFYHIDPIREILGSSIVAMYFVYDTDSRTMLCMDFRRRKRFGTLYCIAGKT